MATKHSSSSPSICSSVNDMLKQGNPLAIQFPQIQPDQQALFATSTDITSLHSQLQSIIENYNETKNSLRTMVNEKYSDIVANSENISFVDSTCKSLSDIAAHISPLHHHIDSILQDQREDSLGDMLIKDQHAFDSDRVSSPLHSPPRLGSQLSNHYQSTQHQFSNIQLEFTTSPSYTVLLADYIHLLYIYTTLTNAILVFDLLVSNTTSNTSSRPLTNTFTLIHKVLSLYSHLTDHILHFQTTFLNQSQQWTQFKYQTPSQPSSAFSSPSNAPQSPSPTPERLAIDYLGFIPFHTLLLRQIQNAPPSSSLTPSQLHSNVLNFRQYLTNRFSLFNQFINEVYQSIWAHFTQLLYGDYHNLSNYTSTQSELSAIFAPQHSPSNNSPTQMQPVKALVETQDKRNENVGFEAISTHCSNLIPSAFLQYSEHLCVQYADSLYQQLVSLQDKLGLVMTPLHSLLRANPHLHQSYTLIKVNTTTAPSPSQLPTTLTSILASFIFNHQSLSASPTHSSLPGPPVLTKPATPFTQPPLQAILLSSPILIALFDLIITNALFSAFLHHLTPSTHFSFHSPHPRSTNTTTPTAASQSTLNVMLARINAKHGSAASTSTPTSSPPLSSPSLSQPPQTTIIHNHSTTQHPFLPFALFIFGLSEPLFHHYSTLLSSTPQAQSSSPPNPTQPLSLNTDPIPPHQPLPPPNSSPSRSSDQPPQSNFLPILNRHASLLYRLLLLASPIFDSFPAQLTDLVRHSLDLVANQGSVHRPQHYEPLAVIDQLTHQTPPISFNMPPRNNTPSQPNVQSPVFTHLHSFVQSDHSTTPRTPHERSPQLFSESHTQITAAVLGHIKTHLSDLVSFISTPFSPINSALRSNTPSATIFDITHALSLLTEIRHTLTYPSHFHTHCSHSNPAHNMPIYFSSPLTATESTLFQVIQPYLPTPMLLPAPSEQKPSTSLSTPPHQPPSLFAHIFTPLFSTLSTTLIKHYFATIQAFLSTTLHQTSLSLPLFSKSPQSPSQLSQQFSSHCDLHSSPTRINTHRKQIPLLLSHIPLDFIPPYYLSLFPTSPPPTTHHLPQQPLLSASPAPSSHIFSLLSFLMLNCVEIHNTTQCQDNYSIITAPAAQKHLHTITIIFLYLLHSDSVASLPSNPAQPEPSSTTATCFDSTHPSNPPQSSKTSKISSHIISSLFNLNAVLRELDHNLLSFHNTSFNTKQGQYYANYVDSLTIYESNFALPPLGFQIHNDVFKQPPIPRSFHFALTFLTKSLQTGDAVSATNADDSQLRVQMDATAMKCIAKTLVYIATHLALYTISISNINHSLFDDHNDSTDVELENRAISKQQKSNKEQITTSPIQSSSSSVTIPLNKDNSITLLSISDKVAGGTQFYSYLPSTVSKSFIHHFTSEVSSTLFTTSTSSTTPTPEHIPPTTSNSTPNPTPNPQSPSLSSTSNVHITPTLQQHQHCPAYLTFAQNITHSLLFEFILHHCSTTCFPFLTAIPLSFITIPKLTSSVAPSSSLPSPSPSPSQPSSHQTHISPHSSTQLFNLSSYSSHVRTTLTPLISTQLHKVFEIFTSSSTPPHTAYPLPPRCISTILHQTQHLLSSNIVFTALISFQTAVFLNQHHQQYESLLFQSQSSSSLSTPSLLSAKPARATPVHPLNQLISHFFIQSPPTQHQISTLQPQSQSQPAPPLNPFASLNSVHVTALAFHLLHSSPTTSSIPPTMSQFYQIAAQLHPTFDPDRPYINIFTINTLSSSPLFFRFALPCDQSIFPQHGTTKHNVSFSQERPFGLATILTAQESAKLRSEFNTSDNSQSPRPSSHSAEYLDKFLSTMCFPEHISKPTHQIASNSPTRYTISPLLTNLIAQVLNRVVNAIFAALLVKSPNRLISHHLTPQALSSIVNSQSLSDVIRFNPTTPRQTAVSPHQALPLTLSHFIFTLESIIASPWDAQSIFATIPIIIYFKDIFHSINLIELSPLLKSLQPASSSRSPLSRGDTADISEILSEVATNQPQAFTARLFSSFTANPERYVDFLNIFATIDLVSRAWSLDQQ